MASQGVTNDGTTIDEVVIRVQSDAKKATGDVVALANALRELKSAQEGGFNNLRRLSGTLHDLSSVSSKLKDLSGAASSIKSIVEALQPINSINGSGFNKAVNGLAKLPRVLPDVTNSMTPTSIKRLTETSEALSKAMDSLGSIKGHGFASAVTAFGQLPEVTENLKPEQAQIFSQMTSDMAQGLDTLSGTNANGFNRVVSSLGKLPNIINQIKPETLDKFSSFGATLAASMRPLENIKANGFSRVVNVFAKLPEVLKNIDPSSLDNVIKISTQLANGLKPLEEIKASGFTSAINALGKLPEKMNAISPAALENIGRVSEELSQKLLPLSDRMRDIAQGYSAISSLANRYGVSVTKIHEKTNTQIHGFKLLKKAILGLFLPYRLINKTSSSFTNGASKQFSKLSSKIKQVGLSLLGTRTLFTLVRKAVSEYMQMDKQLTDNIQNVWRAMGALLAPAVEEAIYLFKQFARVVYSVIKALTGYDLIARANAKATTGWSKNTKDLLASLQKFDDLNVAEFKKGKGDDMHIDLQEIDLTPIQKIVDWMKKLKETIIDALNSGGWKQVGVVLGEGLNGAIDTFLNNSVKIKDKLKEISNEFSGFLNGALETINWKNFGEAFSKTIKEAFITIQNILDNINWSKVGEGVTNFIDGIDFDKLIHAIFGLTNSLFVNISTALINVDWSVVGKKISTGVSAFLDTFNDLIKSVDWSAVGKSVANAIKNIDWKQLISDIADIIKNIFKGANDFGKGLFGEENWEGIRNSILVVGALIGTIFGVGKIFKFKKSVVDTFDTISGFFGKKKGNPISDAIGDKDDIKSPFSGLQDAAKYIAVLGGLALVIKSVSELMKTLSKTGTTAGKMWGVMTAIMTPLVAVMGAVAFLGPAMSDGLLPFVGIVGTISALLLVLSGTLPTILDAAGKFVNKIAPPIIDILNILSDLIMDIVTELGEILIDTLDGVGEIFDTIFSGITDSVDTTGKAIERVIKSLEDFSETTAPIVYEVLDIIGDLIKDIIRLLGGVLVNVIKEVGDVFNTILTGIGDIISTVGNTITDVLTSIADLVDRLADTILRFIRDIGPAIETFVDSAIRSFTKLINFMISGIEYTINTLIINSLNGLVSKMNEIIPGSKHDLGRVGKVYISRFVPKLETGTNEIPNEGLYHLHQGEAVVPKKYNPALNNNTNNETNQKLDALLYAVENMSFTNTVNVGNETLYQKQEKFNRYQMNKYGVIDL